jgi:uncharacterized repeat protein (TIGR03803 family)
MDSAGNLYGTTIDGGAYGNGAVFKINANGTESVLYSFGPSIADGYTPSALIMDSAGSLYGTTRYGGTNGFGTAFRLDPSGAKTVLYSFGSSFTDAQLPAAGLIMDSSGNLYGMAGGGANYDGTVFKIGANGAETILYSFGANATDGQSPWASLIMDSAGNLYGTTYGGGSNGDGTAFKISANGTETILHSFGAGVADGQYPGAGLIMDSAGNLYGTTRGGGTNGSSVGGYGTVFKISAAGMESVLYSFGASSTDGWLANSGLVLDTAGNIYGTTVNGGTNGGGTLGTFGGGTVYVIN